MVVLPVSRGDWLKAADVHQVDSTNLEHDFAYIAQPHAHVWVCYENLWIGTDIATSLEAFCKVRDQSVVLFSKVRDWIALNFVFTDITNWFYSSQHRKESLILL